jgi:hypothetical protein
MPLTTATKELVAGYVTGLGDYISLHTGDPSTTGANEATGGSPAYARKQTTWSAGSSDGIYTGTEVSIDVPAGTYTYAGVWSAVSGGTFRGSQAITSATYGGQTVVKVTPSFSQK